MGDPNNFTTMLEQEGKDSQRVIVQLQLHPVLPQLSCPTI
jgi:hypothetical protein